IVHNRVKLEQMAAKSSYWTGRCEQLLYEANGAFTQTGVIRVETRENVGLSFGGYNFAFHKWSDSYDNWFFAEDDQVMVKDGYFRCALEQLEDPAVGFVAVVGVSTNRRHPPHAHGGVVVSTKAILKQVQQANRDTNFPDGRLPFYANPGYDRQNLMGEIPFTNAIHRLGYRLENLRLTDVCVSWGESKKRTPRTTVWDPTLHSFDHEIYSDPFE
ncbi:MAG: hypothetical protein KDA84_27250, partial [Planctomycetaceae bacterium]|nr:hypothetical protein [Planctomycetaceae bacterium]